VQSCCVIYLEENSKWINELSMQEISTNKCIHCNGAKCVKKLYIYYICNLYYYYYYIYISLLGLGFICNKNQKYVHTVELRELEPL